MGMIKSSEVRQHHVLGAISPARAQDILKRLANLPDWPVIGERADFDRNRTAIEKLRSRFPEVFKNYSTWDVMAARELLRKAWASPDLRSKEWSLFRLRYFHAQILLRVGSLQKMELRAAQDEKAIVDFTWQHAPNLDRVGQGLLAHKYHQQTLDALKTANPPPLTQLEAAACYLQTNLRRALYCKGPECAAPYFFIKRKGQEYCSNDCLKPVQKESKRKWWEKNGKLWKENRAESKSKRGR